jgi:hypothetical protein
VGSEAELSLKNPIRGTLFAGCCASVEEQNAKSRAVSVRSVICFMSFSLYTRYSTLALSHLIPDPLSPAHSAEW